MVFVAAILIVVTLGCLLTEHLLLAVFFGLTTFLVLKYWLELDKGPAIPTKTMAEAIVESKAKIRAIGEELDETDERTPRSRQKVRCLKCESTGKQNFQIVGESFYQANFREICGRRTRIPKYFVTNQTILLPEDNNPKDPNAVAVFMEGLQVGYLSRDDARHFRELAINQAIQCDGRIKGGWSKGKDDQGSFGCFLDFDFERLQRTVDEERRYVESHGEPSPEKLNLAVRQTNSRNMQFGLP